MIKTRIRTCFFLKVFIFLSWLTYMPSAIADEPDDSIAAWHQEFQMLLNDHPADADAVISFMEQAIEWIAKGKHATFADYFSMQKADKDETPSVEISLVLRNHICPAFEKQRVANNLALLAKAIVPEGFLNDFDTRAAQHKVESHFLQTEKFGYGYVLFSRIAIWAAYVTIEGGRGIKADSAQNSFLTWLRSLHEKKAPATWPEQEVKDKMKLLYTVFQGQWQRQQQLCSSD